MACYSYVNEALSSDFMLTVRSLHACKAVQLAIIACVCSKNEQKGWGRYFSYVPLSPFDSFCKHVCGQLVKSQGEERSKITAENTSSSNKPDVSSCMFKFFTYVMLKEGRRWFLFLYWSKSLIFLLLMQYQLQGNHDCTNAKVFESLFEAHWFKIMAIVTSSFFLSEYCTFLLSLWFLVSGWVSELNERNCHVREWKKAYSSLSV